MRYSWTHKLQALSGIIRHYPALSGIIRHYPALSGIITRFSSFLRAKKYSPHLCGALLAALLSGIAPQAWAAAPCGGNSFNNYWSDPSCGGAGSDNTSVIVDYDFTGGYAYGGYSDKDDASAINTDGKANGNILTIESSGKVEAAYGGYVSSNSGGAEANNNEVVLDGVVMGGVFGGVVRDNSLTGGSPTPSSATGNKVTISGGSASGVTGGYTIRGSATGNTVILAGGSVWVDVTGGRTNNGNATGNTVILAGGSVGDSVWGGSCSSSGCDKVSGNTLIVDKAKNFSVGMSVFNFAALEFTLPHDIADGDTVLKAGNYATFPATSTSVAITVTGSPALKVGDTITLIEAGTLTIRLPSTPTIIPAGGYEFEVSKDGNKLIATVTRAPPYDITDASDKVKGSISCTVNPVTTSGGRTTCTATAEPGYTYDDGSITLVNGSATANCSGDTCELTNITSALTVRATFTLNEYSVQGNSAAGGSVDCPATLVPHGSGTRCKLTIRDGYTFTATYEGDAKVLYNPNTEEFEVSDVKSAVTITATFTLNEYSVQPAASIENGSLSDCTPATINHGDPLKVTCTATPDKGYEFTSLTLTDGKTDTSCEDTTCSLKNVQGNVTVSAVFSKISISPAVVSINDDSGNKERLRSGKANTVRFTLGVDSFNGDSGTLEITGVTKSQALQKAYFDDDKNKKSIDVRIENGGFTAVITPEKGEKTIEVTLIVAGVSYPFSFKVASVGTAAPVPTMSDIGLLLSGLVLAGAAAPALRRRERKEGKQ